MDIHMRYALGDMIKIKLDQSGKILLADSQEITARIAEYECIAILWAPDKFSPNRTVSTVLLRVPGGNILGCTPLNSSGLEGIKAHPIYQNTYEIVEDTYIYNGRSVIWIGILNIIGETPKKINPSNDYFRCSNCTEPIYMAGPNQPDGKTFICWSCVQNPYGRRFTYKG